MQPIISRNLYLFRDKAGLSLYQLSKRIEEQQQIYLSPIELKSYEEEGDISASDLFYIALALRVNIAELVEENPILD